MSRMITRGDTLKNFGEFLPTPVIEKIIIKNDFEADFKVSVYMNASQDPLDETDEEVFKRLRDLKFYLFGVGKKMPNTESDRGKHTDFDTFDEFVNYLASPDTIHGYSPVSQLSRMAQGYSTHMIGTGWGATTSILTDIWGYSEGTLYNYCWFKFEEMATTSETLYTDGGFRILKYTTVINSREKKMGLPAARAIGPYQIDWFGYFAFCSNHDDINKNEFITNPLMKDIPPTRRVLDADVGALAEQADHPWFQFKQAQINAGDIMYLVFMEDGAIGGKPRPVWVDEVTEAPYNDIPLQEIAGAYHRSEPTSHADIVKDFQTLIDLYRRDSAYSGHTRLQRQLDFISNILSTNQDKPRLLPQLRRAIRSFPEKGGGSPIGRLFNRLSRKLFNANQGVRSNRRVVKRLMYDTVIVDERTVNLMVGGSEPITSGTEGHTHSGSGLYYSSIFNPGGTLWATPGSMLMTRRTLIGSRTGEGLDEHSLGIGAGWFGPYFEYTHGAADPSTGIVDEDASDVWRLPMGYDMIWSSLSSSETVEGMAVPGTEIWYRFYGVDDDKFSAAGMYNGFYFVDLDYYLHYKCNLSMIFNINKIEHWFGPWMLNGAVLFTRTQMDRFSRSPEEEWDENGTDSWYEDAYRYGASGHLHSLAPSVQSQFHQATMTMFFDYSMGYPKPDWGKYYAWELESAYPEIYLFQPLGTVAAMEGEEDTPLRYSQHVSEAGSSFVASSAPGDGAETWGERERSQSQPVRSGIRLRNFQGAFDQAGPWGNYYETEDGYGDRINFRNYRLATFQFTDLMGPDDAFNDYAVVCTSIFMYDRSYGIGRVLVEKYKEALDAYEEYRDTAMQECSYNNLDDRFNEFFIDAVMEIWGERMEEAPWVVAATVYYIHLDILFNTFDGDKELLALAAKGLADQLSPAAASMSQIQAFMDVMQELYDLYYGYGSRINLHLYWEDYETGETDRKDVSGNDGFVGSFGDFSYDSSDAVFVQNDPKYILYKLCNEVSDMGECMNLIGWQELAEAYTTPPTTITPDEDPTEPETTITVEGIDWDVIQDGLDLVNSVPPVIQDYEDSLEWMDDIWRDMTDMVGSLGFDIRDWMMEDTRAWWESLLDFRYGPTFPPADLEDYLSFFDTTDGLAFLEVMTDIARYLGSYIYSESLTTDMGSLTDMIVGELLDPKCGAGVYDATVGINIDRYTSLIASAAMAHRAIDVYSMSTLASTYNAASSYAALAAGSSTTRYATDVYSAWGCESGFTSAVSSYLAYKSEMSYFDAAGYASWMMDSLPPPV